MKLPILLSILILSASPAWTGTIHKGGVFNGENYAMTFWRIRNTDHKYTVSVVEARSVKDNHGFIVPSALTFDCENGKADGFVAMGKQEQAFIEDVLRYYFVEFCTRNGYKFEVTQ